MVSYNIRDLFAADANGKAFFDVVVIIGVVGGGHSFIGDFQVAMKFVETRGPRTKFHLGFHLNLLKSLLISNTSVLKIIQGTLIEGDRTSRLTYIH